MCMLPSADPDKVRRLAESIAEIGLQEPVGTWHSHVSEIHVLWSQSSMQVLYNTLLCMQIDVLDVDGQLYGFSGCHRYEVRWADELQWSTASLHACHCADGMPLTCRPTRCWEERPSCAESGRAARLH